MKKNKKISILLADDHILFRRGLRELLSDVEEFQIIGEASNGEEVVDFARNEQPDIILLDINMPKMSGLEALSAIRRFDPKTRIIMLTVSEKKSDIIASILAGVDGYILKNEDVKILVNAIRKAYLGEKVVSERIMPLLFKAIQEKNDFPAQVLLSPRELEILQHLQAGKKNEEIAEDLFVSENTVKTHLKHIYEKMTVSCRDEAVNKGLLWGLLKENRG